MTASCTGRGRFWWMRYWDRDGTRRLESTETSDWQEAQTRLRERLQARDENVLAMVRRGQQLRFHEWADFFLEHYSQPPLRSMKTHAANQNAFEATQARVRSANVVRHRRRGC